MYPISIDDLKTLFTEARSHSVWTPREVSDQQLRDIYDLFKWGPTSANSSPARFVFVRSAVEKEKLISCLSSMNVDKVRSAPVTAIIAFDERFYDLIPKLLPHAPKYREVFVANKALAETTAFRNSSLQGGYFILAARALGLDCGPMSGFENEKLNETFFSGTTWKSNFICSLGYADTKRAMPRSPRLDFDEACRIV